MSTIHSVCPLAELRAWLTASVARFRSLRLFGPVAREEVAIDIVEDAITQSNRAAALAHKSETYDREAAADLRALLAEPTLSRHVRRHLQRVRRLVLRSAEADHDASEAATVPPV